jgi:amino acid adenylation domain-containing protein
MLKQIQGFQLSPQQKRLWLLQQDNSAYCARSAVLIEGNLQVDVFKTAFKKIIDRNEILRTNFHQTSGIKIPIQVIENNPSLCLHEESYLEAEINQIFQQVSKQYFDWKKSPLLHINLVKLLPEKHILLINLPAMCADTATLNNLVNEISHCYSSCLLGKEITSEPLQYADIAAWQNELLQAEEITAQRKYWQQLDISALNTCKLSFEYQLSETRDFKPEFLSLPVKNNFLVEIDSICQQYQTSKTVLFLTTWLILLWRLTGKSKQIIGMGCDGRNYEDLVSALGLFAKYLPLVCDLAASDRFSDILTKVTNHTAELAEWQESFSWETNEQSQEQPFFPFCFEFQEAAPKYITDDVSFTLYQQYVCFDRFKVKLACISTADNSLNAEFHYDANLFYQADIQRLANQWQTLLASIVENPTSVISQLNILSTQERQQLLIDFNQTKTAEPEHECIQHWFEQQCDRTPDNIAVIYQNQQLTYGELNTKANQLAHYLQQLGVGSDVLVGICIERQPLMAIALFAILKAGGAYVPIDPNYPLERKAFILSDTQMPVLLTQQHLQDNLPQATQTQVICLDADWQAIDQQPQENPVSQTSALNLAYLIYTSGSTGKPKGTMIPHSGLINYLSWCIKAYRVDQGIGTLVHSPISFDLTITSLFSPLLVGCSVNLLPENQGIETLSQALLQSHNLSLVKITPAHLELLKTLSPETVAGRTRAFIIGGENLTSQHIDFWQEFTPDTMLVNEYGPTETVVGCCIYQVSDRYQSGSIPIGQPIANTQLYVLDKHLQPVPVGVPGELYIAGKGLARGYLNRSELTAEKFIPNPFSQEPGERLYKTGDLVSHSPTGVLEFLGRIDHQVKLRGFRIELEEIAAVLLKYPSVQESVAIVREDVVGDQRLVAYIVVNPESAFNINDLRDFLQQKLPDYMVPSLFVPLKNLPLTPNGKIDRQALPAPDQVRPEQAGLFIAPRNSTEIELANIWAELLRIERIGVYDNFFDLGGHSLLATQLISRVRDAFQVELLVRHIFAAPTVADLAAIVVKKLTEQADEKLLAEALAELEESS